MEELLWKYAEGNCNATEIAKVEALLTKDAGLQKELDSIFEVQSHLKAMKPSAPSMRFTQNVLEALPKNYFVDETEPLVKPIWKKLFFSALAACFAILIFTASSSSSSANKLPYQDNVTRFINDVVTSLPSVTVQFSIMVLLSLVLLMLMDKMMLRKIRGLLMI